MNTDQYFYELLRIALGTQHNLSGVPTQTEWKVLYKMAKKQNLVGICFAGVQKVCDLNHRYYAGMPEVQYLKWMGLAAKIQQRNQTFDNQCAELQKKFAAAGFRSCILKGRGVATLYKNLASLRENGDIDIWVDGTWRQVMDYVNAISPNREFDRKHTHLELFENTTIEIHWLPSILANPLWNKKLQNYYDAAKDQQMTHEVELNSGIGVIAPDEVFQCVHLMLHVYVHFLYEGIGLRQLMDLYFAIRTEQAQEARHFVEQCYRDFGCHRIARQVMWVLSEVFGLEPQYLICEPDERGGRQLLCEIMEGGSLGQHSQENLVVNEHFAHRMLRRLNRRLRLVRYNPVGTICTPWNKISLLLWKCKVIRMYNL